MTEWLLSTLQALASDPLLLVLTIIAASLVSEDATTVGVALLISQDVVGAVFGLAAVNAGIIVGDAGLYGMGALGARYRSLRKLVATRRVYRAKRWVRQRLGPVLLATRFLPGSRLPLYTACGFFRFPFVFFVAVLSVGSLLWTGFVFTIVIVAGRTVLEALGPWKWLGALIILILGLVLPHLVGPQLARAFGVTRTLDDEAREEQGEGAR